MGIALREAKRMDLALPGLALAEQLYLALAAERPRPQRHAGARARARGAVEQRLADLELTRERLLALVNDLRGSRSCSATTAHERRGPRRLARERHSRSVAPDQDVWVFGYGSLMWNPAFHHVELRPARLHGWHRSFCLWNTFGRGSPEKPGLMLALQPGGACAGVALRIAADAVPSELGVLWNREMLTGAYLPRWVGSPARRARSPP